MIQEVSGTPTDPFWKKLPLANIHDAITPDVLHQLYQGVFKHLVNWCTRIVGAEELDRRIRTLPPMHGVRHFKNGFSALSQISGSERKHMARILLGCLVGVLPQQGILACRALLDFIYLAQYRTHDDITLGYLETALATFHANKQYFVMTGVREHLHIPKFHSLMHYLDSIRMLGTTDNYNTEMFERLHIDFAKEGWRASNQRDAFPQMITWLSRREKMQAFENYIYTSNPSLRPTPPTSHIRSLPKYPSQPRKPITLIGTQHDAPSFSQALKLLLNQTLSQPTSARVALGHPLPFEKVDVFHIFKFHPTRIDDEAVVELERDVIKASPGRNGKPGTFDTVVVLQRDDAESTGLRGEQDGDQYHYIISSSNHYRYKGRTSQSHFQATREAQYAGTNHQPPLYLAQ